MGQSLSMSVLVMKQDSQCGLLLKMRLLLQGHILRLKMRVNSRCNMSMTLSKESLICGKNQSLNSGSGKKQYFLDHFLGIEM